MLMDYYKNYPHGKQESTVEENISSKNFQSEEDIAFFDMFTDDESKEE